MRYCRYCPEVAECVTGDGTVYCEEHLIAHAVPLRQTTAAIDDEAELMAAAALNRKRES